MMTSEELDDYLTDILGVKRPTKANDDSSFGGDAPQQIKATKSFPSKWIFVGKTLLGPSSYEGSDVGICKPRPLEAPYAGLYSRGAAGKTIS
jgi:hypothetical protein